MKFCKDCKYYRSSPLGFDLAKCADKARKGERLEYFTEEGGYVSIAAYSQYCVTARRKPSDICSPSGKQWESKPTPITFFNKLKGLFTK